MVGDHSSSGFTRSAIASLPGLLLATSLGTHGAILLAQTGPLPKGDLSEIDAGKVSVPSQNAPERPKSCKDVIANPFGAPMEYTSDGSRVWWFAKLGLTDALAKDNGPEDAGKDGVNKNRYTLFNLEIKTRIAVPHIGANLVEPFAMLLRRNAVTLINFDKGPKGLCFEGPGTLLDVSTNKKNEAAVQQRGEFLIFGASSGRRIFDPSKNAIIETDPSTGQRRKVRKVPQGERPLYWDEWKSQLTTLATRKGKKELVTYLGEKNIVQKRDSWPVNTRLLLGAAGSFLALETLGRENALKIHELSSWSGAGQASAYKITLPWGLSPYAARVEVDPSQGIALVSGETVMTREAWQQVLIFRYRLGQLLTTVSFDGSQYPNLAAISPKGDTIFVEVRSKLSGKTVGGRIVDVKSGKVKPIQMTIPPG
jgi:hypothetical protein